MTWFEFLPSLGLAVAAFVVPGAVVLGAARMRGFFALAAAPAVSTSIVALSAVAAPVVGLRWGWWPPIALTALFSLAAAAFGWIRARRGPDAVAPVRLPKASPAWWIAFALSAALWARHLLNVLDRPDTFSLTYDGVWHLNAIRWILDTGDASSLTIAHLNGSGGGFYPAAFHDIASLVAAANGAPLPVASNAVVVAICALVWPLSAMFLVRAIFRPGTVTIVGFGVLVASFPSFPLLLIDYGVLYANLLGLALLPVALGALVQLLGLGRDRWLDAPRSLLVGSATLPGLALAHPNAVMSLLLISVVLLAATAFRQWRMLPAGTVARGTAWRRIGAAVAVVALIASAWPFMRPGTDQYDWLPTLTSPAAVGYALTNAPIDIPASWFVSLLMVAGIAAARSRRLLWLVGAWVTLAAFWVVAASFPPTRLRLLLVGGWYNDFIRFSAILPILALPLAALGQQAVTEWAASRAGLLRRPVGVRASRWVVPVVAAAVAVVCVAGTQRTASMNAAIERASGEYAMTESSFVTSDEYALMMRLPGLVPRDAVIAVDPWTGSAFAYALAGRDVTMPHLLFAATPLREAVRDRLDEVATDPAHCQLLKENRVRYALDFGRKGVFGDTSWYTGFDRLGSAPGFREVARQGDAVLYEITAC